MKKIGWSVLALLMIIGLAAFVAPSQKGDNQLSAKEKKDGWQLLFDGSSTNGWRAYKNKPTDGWAVENGWLVCKMEGVKNRADLITADQYESFILELDWKIEKAHNSGIIYHSTEENGASYESGPEYQLIDDLGYPDKLSDKQLSGANYDMNAPSAKVAKPAGELNHTKIVVNGAKVEHWLNGTKVVEYEFWTPEWEKNKSNSKWRDVKPYGMSKKGHIAFQDHGGGVAFKNIKIKVLK